MPSAQLISTGTPARLGVALAGLVAALGCHDEPPRPHVFRAPPPGIVTVSTVDALPALPIGTAAAETRIEGVSDAATGGPVALEQVTAAIQLLALAARGPHRPRDEAATLQLVLRGPTDTVLAHLMDRPAPSIIAHAFLVPVAQGEAAGLRVGRYIAQVWLLSGRDTLASSLPIYFTVRARRQ